MDERSLIIIPTYQESANIAEVLRRTRASAPAADVLVIDDGSPDGTANIVRDVASELGHITVLERAEKSGLGNAYRAGFGYGLSHGYEVLVEMDADLSHDPAVLPELLDAVAHGADLSIGSRYVPGGSTPAWSRHRRLLSRAGNRYAQWALGLGINDATSGFRAFRATMLRAIDATTSEATGYAFQIELAYRVAQHGAAVTEVPIAFHERESGKSKMSSRITIEALLLVSRWALRDRVFHRLPRQVPPAHHPADTGAAVAA